MLTGLPAERSGIQSLHELDRPANGWPGCLSTRLPAELSAVRMQAVVEAQPREGMRIARHALSRPTPEYTAACMHDQLDACQHSRMHA
eukprot:366239-Chlamydomonas_euryale.AAC.45